MSDYTHAELVTLAARWCRKGHVCRVPYYHTFGPHSVVTTEVVAGRSTPDVIAWCGASTVQIECKATRADFLADKKKPHRIHIWMAGVADEALRFARIILDVDEHMERHFNPPNAQANRPAQAGTV